MDIWDRYKLIGQSSFLVLKSTGVDLTTTSTFVHGAGYSASAIRGTFFAHLSGKQWRNMASVCDYVVYIYIYCCVYTYRYDCESICLAWFHWMRWRITCAAALCPVVELGNRRHFGRMSLLPVVVPAGTAVQDVSCKIWLLKPLMYQKKQIYTLQSLGDCRSRFTHKSFTQLFWGLIFGPALCLGLQIAKLFTVDICNKSLRCCLKLQTTQYQRF